MFLNDFRFKRRSISALPKNASYPFVKALTTKFFKATITATNIANIR